jgi:hypothetical protein
MSENRVDRAIDRAVREMMSAEPRPGLRARVLARMAAPAPRGIWWPRLSFAALAAAALIVVATLLRTDVPQPGREAAPPLATRTAPSEPSAAAPPAATAPGVRPPAAASGVRRESLPPPPRMDAVFGGSLAGVTAASVAPADALFLDHAAPEPLAGPPPLLVREITVEPLVVEPIRIPPMFPPR